MIVSFSGHTDVVHILIEAHADINQRKKVSVPDTALQKLHGYFNQ